MKKKTFLKVLLCLMLCAAVLGWFQLRPYQVEDDGSNLEEQLTAWHERDGSSVTLTPLDTLTIGDVRYVTYEMEPEGRLFYALLLRGPNGRWKLEHSRGGTQLYLEEIREIGGTPYLIFLGKNIGRRSPPWRSSWKATPTPWSSPRQTTSWFPPLWNCRSPRTTFCPTLSTISMKPGRISPIPCTGTAFPPAVLNNNPSDVEKRTTGFRLWSSFYLFKGEGSCSRDQSAYISFSFSRCS